MKNNKDGQVLIEFLNQMTTNDKLFSEEISQLLLQKREKLPNQRFSSIQEIASIKGIGEKRLKMILELVDYKEKEVHLLKSRTIFSFLGDAPPMKDYQGKVKFEAVPSAEKNEGELRDYYLYYTSDLDREQLISQIKHTSTYKGSFNDPWFAIQTHSGHFLSVANDQLGFASAITGDEAFRFSKSMRNGFDIHNPQLYPIHSTRIIAQRNHGRGGLFYDYGRKEVAYNPNQNNSNHPNPNAPFHFDLFGQNSPAGSPHKAFTLMNYWQYSIGRPRPAQDGNGIDERRFITATGAGLLGHHYDSPGWLPQNWYRYVDIVENMSLEVKQLSSKNQQWYVSTNHNGNVALSARITGNPIPQEALFDMYVFYGRWEDHSNIATRVVFRSKLNGRCLAVDMNNNVTCTSLGHHWNETFFIEQGWGGHYNDVSLKTAHGKYLLGFLYQGSPVVKADAVTALTLEQFRVVYP